MKALICERLGNLDDLRVAEVAVPAVTAGAVRVRVFACGLNFPDVLMVQGKYQRKPPMPFSPGAEFSGIVDAVGEAVTAVAPGDRVCGTAAYGALAEFVAVAEGDVTRIGDGVDLGAAAAMPYTYSTALYALRERATLRSAESVLVLGAGGGIGTATVDLAKAFGARVVAAASSEAKLSFARENGADATLCYPAVLNDPQQPKDLAGAFKAAAGERGFDVICDPVGGAYAEPALRSIAWQGRYLVVGFAAGAIPSIPLNLPLLKSCQIVGVSWGGAFLRDPPLKTAIQHELGAMLAAGRIHPWVTERLPLDRGAEAIKRLAERRAVGKILVLC